MGLWVFYCYPLQGFRLPFADDVKSGRRDRRSRCCDSFAAAKRSNLPNERTASRERIRWNPIRLRDTRTPFRHVQLFIEDRDDVSVRTRERLPFKRRYR